ncbi:hypothetical protein V6N11_068186 [Hibiscus sabdariffa]|uniref:Uncharacterized protein n=1 Tax=Hibiscus sabdariffa TaxID=183260 RepID=A0ABR2STA1_9ROSI
MRIDGVLFHLKYEDLQRVCFMYGLYGHAMEMSEDEELYNGGTGHGDARIGGNNVGGNDGCGSRTMHSLMIESSGMIRTGSRQWDSRNLLHTQVVASLRGVVLQKVHANNFDGRGQGTVQVVPSVGTQASAEDLQGNRESTIYKVDSYGLDPIGLWP